jgi:predicted nuclease of predicted toxin-antitoxin system
VKLLLDENLSRRIVAALHDTYPDSTQVALVGREHASDREVWEFARHHGFTIVTKDDDFTALLSLYGAPPKVILLAMGNCTNQRVIDALLNNQAKIENAFTDPDVSLLELL